MNPKEFVHNTAYSVQLPYIAGHSLLNLLMLFLYPNRPLPFKIFYSYLIFVKMCSVHPCVYLNVL